MEYITRQPSFLFRFDDDGRITHPPETLDANTGVLLSTHKLTGFECVVGRIPRDHYVLCMVYFTDGVLDDTQLGCTGSVNFRKEGTRFLNESCEYAAVREIAEEAGLFLDPAFLANRVCRKHSTRKGDQHVATFTASIDGCTQYKPEIHDMREELHATHANGWGDNRRSKVQVLIHGSLGSMIGTVSRVTHRIESRDLTSIRALRLFHQMDVYEGMRLLDNG